MIFDKESPEHHKLFVAACQSVGIALATPANKQMASALKAQAHGVEMESVAQWLSAQVSQPVIANSSNSKPSPVVGKGPKNRVSGLVKMPYVMVVHGQPGSGKSYFASYSDKPFFVDAERGTVKMDVERDLVADYQAILDDVDWFFEQKEFNTLVLDTINAIEVMCQAHICKQNGWDSMNDPKAKQWANGATMANNEFVRLITKLKNKSVETGKNVIMLGHSSVKNTPNPSGEDYERLCIDLHKGLIEKVFGSADYVFYISFETQLKSADPNDKNSKLIADTTKRRVLHTGGQPNVVSKNRCAPGVLAQVTPLPLITATDDKKEAFSKIFAVL